VWFLLRAQRMLCNWPENRASGYQIGELRLSQSLALPMKTMKAGTFMVVFCQKCKYGVDEERRLIYGLWLIKPKEPWAVDTGDLPVATLSGLLVRRRPTRPGCAREQGRSPEDL
jgi:hypothetical protein